MRPAATFPVAPHIFGVRTVMVNVYLVAVPSEPNAWVLIDGGLRGGGPHIWREAKHRFGRVPPRAVILTHGHFDHVGALPWLLQRWRVPVYAHALELPYLNSRQPSPPADPSVGGGLLARLSGVYPRRPARLPVPVHPLPASGEVPALPLWRWVPTPGHSPGHVSLWREADGVLLSGDAVVTTRQESALAVWRQRRELRPPPAYFTPEWSEAFASMQRLRALPAVTLASGHGLPLQGEAWKRDFDRLLAEFPHRGLPRRGRYVRSTWLHPAHA